MDFLIYRFFDSYSLETHLHTETNDIMHQNQNQNQNQNQHQKTKTIKYPFYSSDAYRNTKITPLQLPVSTFSLLRIFFSSNRLPKLRFYFKVHHNVFLSPEILYDFERLFCHFQRYYRIFTNLARNFRRKKSKIIVDHDLLLNKLQPGDKFVFSLSQNGMVYLFHIRELIKLIHMNISNASSFFFAPLPIKNPYNNMILNKSTLYNIYFFVIFHTLFDAHLLRLFFRTNFDIHVMLIQHGPILRKHSIQDYLNSETLLLRGEIEDMIYFYNGKLKDNEQELEILIDIDFPLYLLIKILKPYLFLYLTFLYSLVNSEAKDAEMKLMKKLKQLSKFNPRFGSVTYISPAAISSNLNVLTAMAISQQQKFLSDNPVFNSFTLPNNKLICFSHPDFYQDSSSYDSVDTFLHSHYFLLKN
jgi:hypothetical protein